MMDKKNDNETQWEKIIDHILIFNLFILILGAFLFLSSVVFSFNGNPNLYNFFQSLWYPIFIPALSLFFTAILIEATIMLVKK